MSRGIHQVIGDHLRKYARQSIAFVARDLPLPLESQPVFLLGCGRSGTTAFGRCCSLLPGVAYLNERWETWFAAYPECDVWTRSAGRRNGRLQLTEVDRNERGRNRLAKQFSMHRMSRRGSLLLAKLPANNFRIRFLTANFPNARFIYLHRSGVEVAASIARLADEGKWFGHDDYKWRQLVALADAEDATAGIPNQCRDNFERGLLEWRISTDHAVRGLLEVPQDRRITMSYDQLVTEPQESMDRISDFLFQGAGRSDRVDFRKLLARRSNAAPESAAMQRHLDIGGQRIHRRDVPSELKEE